MRIAARALTALLATATLVASGCGGDSSKMGASTGAPAAGAPAAPASIAGCAAEALPAGTSLTGVWIGPAGEVWVAGDDGFVGRRLADGTGAGAWSWCRPGPTVDLHAIRGAAADDIWAVGNGGTIVRWNGATWLTVTDAARRRRAICTTCGAKRRGRSTVPNRSGSSATRASCAGSTGPPGGSPMPTRAMRCAACGVRRRAC